MKKSKAYLCKANEIETIYETKILKENQNYALLTESYLQIKKDLEERKAALILSKKSYFPSRKEEYRSLKLALDREIKYSKESLKVLKIAYNNKCNELLVEKKRALRSLELKSWAT